MRAAGWSKSAPKIGPPQVARVTAPPVGVRAALPLFAILAIACSRHGEATLALSDDAAPSASTALSASAPSPFSAAGAAVPDDPSRFPVRLAALAWETHVKEQPSATSRRHGYMRAGGIVAASSEGKRGEGCRGEWRAVAPVGYVCLEPGGATLDVDHPIVHALSTRPNLSERLPYMYGIVRRPGPIYGRLPTLAEAQAAEPNLEARMRAWLAESGEGGAEFRADYWRRGKTDPTPAPLTLWDSHATVDVPDWLAGKFPPGNLAGLRHGDDLVVGATKNHNGFALVETAVVEGRRYGITTALLVFPVDRMRPIEGSAFHGFRVPEDVDFPFALVRREGAKAYELHRNKLVEAHDVARRSAVRLSGKQRFFGGVLHFETTDGLWLSDRFASRVDGVKKMPKWGNDGERWLDISIGKQVLLAYEGTKPAYATLISTGEAGIADPATSKSTVRGIFRIHTKHLTTTMSSAVVGEEFALEDIPFVQYFEEGYALHAAYWHDDFGTPRSHGCINLSPEDAKWLFSWTEPQLPRGWHAVRQALRGSVVFVHP